MDKLDREGLCACRLFREHCTFYKGVFVKDLSRLGRRLKDIIIVDNSPSAYMFQPENALPILSWYDNMNDHVLYEFLPILAGLSKVEDVRTYLKRFVFDNQVHITKAYQIMKPIAAREEDTHMQNLVMLSQPGERSPSENKYRDDGPLSRSGNKKAQAVEIKKPLLNTWTQNIKRQHGP